jgi:hypothetical protein
MKLDTRCIWFIAVTGVSALALACGGSDDDDGDGATSGGTSGTGGRSSGSGGTSSTSGGTTSMGTGASCGDPAAMGMDDCPAYVECATTQCATQYDECLGAGWEAGNFSGGKCETFMECAAACDCEDTSCGTECFNNAGADCTNCLTSTVGACVATHCLDEATSCGSGGTGGTGSGGTASMSTKTCADLQACCNSLSGTDKTDCQTLYDQIQAAGDVACSSTYQIYQLNGLCQ